jgi:hypothetical protein
LRPIGQSNKCCPEGFYSENKWFSMETFPAGNVTVSSIPDLYKTHKNRQDLEFCLPCDGNEVRQQQLMNMYSKKDSESELLWYHTGDFSLENIRHAKSGLKRILFYRHYDLREYQQYNRYPYALYLEDANKAEQLNADREETTKKRKASKPKGVKGLKGYGHLLVIQSLIYPITVDHLGFMQLLVVYECYSTLYWVNTY